jgi:hypothetical protein
MALQGLQESRRWRLNVWGKPGIKSIPQGNSDPLWGKRRSLSSLVTKTYRTPQVQIVSKRVTDGSGLNGKRFAQ